MQTLLVKSRNSDTDNCLQLYLNLCSRTCGLDSEPPVSHSARDAASSSFKRKLNKLASSDDTQSILRLSHTRIQQTTKTSRQLPRAYHIP